MKRNGTNESLGTVKGVRSIDVTTFYWSFRRFFLRKCRCSHKMRQRGSRSRIKVKLSKEDCKSGTLIKVNYLVLLEFSCRVVKTRPTVIRVM